MNPRTIFSLAACGALVAGAASAQDRAARFAERDLNRDGVISGEEYTSTGGHPGNFHALDVNNDGVLSRGEFINRTGAVEDEPVYTPGVGGTFGGIDGVTPPGATAATYEAFRAKDRNRDGLLTRAEYDDPPTFDRVDRNDDNRISFDEFLNPAPPTTRQEQYVSLDRNRDGVVSRAEWTAEAGVFHLADRNGDGVVTMREYLSAPAGETYDLRFEQVDLNHDGVIVRREWPAADAGGFDRADRNNDGAVTRWEFANATPNPSTPPVEMNFDEMDHNDDGVINRWEWHADRATFDRMDANRDGVLTYREFQTTLPADTRNARFQELDKNRDRQISRTEWPSDRESFAILDRNRDGVLSVYEYLDTRGLMERFTLLDDNQDDALDRGEWTGTPATFRLLDRDRDGRVSRDEFGG